MDEKIFLTIRQTAKLGLISEFRMRCMVKQGTLPGVYSGKRFLVNVPLLRELLDSESRKYANGGEA